MTSRGNECNNDRSAAAKIVDKQLPALTGNHVHNCLLFTQYTPSLMTELEILCSLYTRSNAVHPSLKSQF